MTIQYMRVVKWTVPATNPSLKAREGDAPSMLTRRGTRANHARKENIPGGKEAVSISPESMASSIPRAVKAFSFAPWPKVVLSFCAHMVLR